MDTNDCPAGDMILCTPFVVRKKPYCLVGSEVQDANRDYILGVDPGYFGYVAEVYSEQLDKKDVQQRAALALRVAYAHGLETLFAMLFAALQAPNCVVGWLRRYQPDDLDALTMAVNQGEEFLCRFPMEAVDWSNIARTIFFAFDTKDDRSSEVIEKFAKAWSRFSHEFSNDSNRAEYNSIKHGFRAGSGGHSLSFGVDRDDEDSASQRVMHSLGGSDYGSWFYDLESAGDFSNHFQLSRHAKNWDPESNAHSLCLISTSLHNILTFLKSVNRFTSDDAHYLLPVDAMFENSMKPLHAVTNSRFKVSTYTALEPMSKNDILATYDRKMDLKEIMPAIYASMIVPDIPGYNRDGEQEANDPCKGTVMTASLRQLADKAGIRIGTCVNRRALENDSTYRETLAREFNIVTPENCLKPGLIHPEPDRYDFAAGDALVAFADEHSMEVHGHTLVWHEQNPKWLIDGNWTRPDLLRIMQEHIETVVGHYSGRIAMWDVVNEGLVSDGGEPRPTFWHEIVGPEYFDHAFRWAHEADPTARLFYNDFGADAVNEKSDAMYKLVSGMLDRGVPIHGVGLQMHLEIDNLPDPDSVRENVTRFGELGLEVQVTEIDVRINAEAAEQPLPGRLDAQAEAFRAMLRALVDSGAGTAFIMWGFSDKYSWLPKFMNRPEWGTIMDEQFAPKPAYTALREALIEIARR